MLLFFRKKVSFVRDYLGWAPKVALMTGFSTTLNSPEYSPVLKIKETVLSTAIRDYILTSLKTDIIEN